MATKTQRIALVSVVVLGAGAVLIDRLVLGGVAEPQTAAAEDLLLKDMGSVPAQVARGSEPGTARNVVTVAHRLNELAKSLPTEADASDTDAFAVPAHWLTKISEQTKVASKGEAGQEAGSPNLHLSMVARNSSAAAKGRGGEMVAYINGQPVKVGGSVEGYTLVEVHASGERGRGTPAAAVLEGPSGRIELTLDPEMPSSGAASHAKQ